jgi:hypothetical protein
VWSQDDVPIFLCAQHALMAWSLLPMEKIKDKNEWLAIFDDLHEVM